MHLASPKRLRSLPQVLWLYSSILWVSMVGELGFAAYCGRVLHLPFPYDSISLGSGVRFSDWYNFLPRVAHFGEPGMLTRPDLGYPFPYPLPSILPFLLVQHVSVHTLRAYLLLAPLCLLAGTALFSWYLHRKFKAGVPVQVAVWSTVLAGYPGIFLIDRGNIEVFLWVLIAGGIFLFLRRRPYLAAICFGIAGSMKIYPTLLLLLFVPRRQYRAIALGALVLCCLTLAMLALVGPTIGQALADMKPAADFLMDTQVMVLYRSDLRFDHSVFADWKQAVAMFHSGVLHQSVDQVNALLFYRNGKVYSVVAPLTFLAAYLLRIRTMPLLNQAVALILCIVLLPYVSYDYTLVHLYTAAALLLVASLEKTSDLQSATMQKVIVLFAVVFTPLSALARHLYGGAIKSVLMLTSLFLILAVPIPTLLFGDQEPTRQPEGKTAEA